MCSRFELNSDSALAARRFSLTVPPPFPLKKELRPTDFVPAIGAGGGCLLPWGLRVEWQAAPLINARAETLADKSTFRPLLERGRVLIPASAWWEWRDDGRRRIKTRIAPADGGIMAFAGLSDGERVVIVTCASSVPLVAVHHRMPAILKLEDEAPWLDSSLPFAEAAKGLRPHDGPFQLIEDIPPPSRQGDLFG